MRKFDTANGNNSQSKVFDIDLLKRKPFELSRLEGFVEGHDDIFDVLYDQKQEQTKTM